MKGIVIPIILLVLFSGCLGYILGCISGQSLTRDIAVEMGCGSYDPETNHFSWKKYH